MYDWEVGVGTVVVRLNWPWNSSLGLLSASLMPCLCPYRPVLPLLEHKDSLQASFKSSIWIFDFKKIFCPLQGLFSSIGSSNVSDIWKAVQYQNQVNSRLLGKVHVCEWVWVSGWVLGGTDRLEGEFDIWSIWHSGHYKKSQFWHWTWQTWNRNQIVPSRIKPRIIPALKYFWRFGWQEAKWSYTGVEPATWCVLLSGLGCNSELHLSPDWPDVLSNHLQECGLFHAAATVGRSRKNVHVIRFGQSLPSYFTQQGELSRVLWSSTSTTCPNQGHGCLWLLDTRSSVQVSFPGKKEYARRVLVCVSLMILACCSWGVATVVDPAWNWWELNTLQDLSLHNMPKTAWKSCRSVGT